MITVEALCKELKEKLHAANIEAPDVEARYIMEQRAQITHSDIIASPDQVLSAQQSEQIASDLKLRLSGKPLSKIYGVREFWGLEFQVNETVLDPRPDTEVLIETALNNFKNQPPEKILDLGTGTACIPIALLKEWPTTTAVAVDISADALRLAEQNAKNHKVDDRIKFVESSWLEQVQDSDFDLITSNPPYIRSDVIPALSIEVQKYDPILALDGGADGLDEYKKILLQIKNKIKQPVNILFEIGYDQEQDLARLVEESRFFVNATHHDLLGNPRVVDISSGDK